MEALQMLEADLEQEKSKVQGILDTADAEGRGLSDTERKSFEEATERVKGLVVKIGSEKEKDKLRELVDGFSEMTAKSANIDPNPVREPATIQTKNLSVGEALIQSDGFKAWSAAYKSAGGYGAAAPKFTTPAVEVPYRTKAVGDPVLESDNTNLFGTSGAGALTTLYPLETPGFRQPRLTLADLIPSVQLTVGNSASYPKVKTRTQVSTTAQTEGSAKPYTEYEFDIVDERIGTYAALIKASTQFLEDAPGLASYINSDLPFQVRQTEESVMAAALYAAAAGPVTGTGITASGNNHFDGLLEAMTLIRMEGFTPNALFIHPIDWAVLLALKFSGPTSYISGGPFAPTGDPWDVGQVVISQSATQGEPLVGAFSEGAKVYRRGGMSVASTNSNEDDFERNLITIRAELRFVLGITYPEAFYSFTVTS